MNNTDPLKDLPLVPAPAGTHKWNQATAMPPMTPELADAVRREAAQQHPAPFFRGSAAGLILWHVEVQDLGQVVQVEVEPPVQGLATVIRLHAFVVQPGGQVEPKGLRPLEDFVVVDKSLGAAKRTEAVERAIGRALLGASSRAGI